MENFSQQSAGSTKINLATGEDYFVSGNIDAEFFGGNFLSQSDRTDGTYLEKASYLGVNLIRFPGGGNTEKYFDVNNPDATSVNGLEIELEPLSNFLANVADLSMSIVIVIPIKKYINSGVSVEEASAEIYEFVKRVTEGEFGDVTIDTFEIGNEFYMGKAEFGTQAVSASQYGEYAAAFAMAIESAASYDVKIAVQSGSHWNDESIAINDNSQIVAAFVEAGAIDAVDILVFHNYVLNFDSVSDRLSVAIPQEVIDLWNFASGKELDLFVSEWNVKSSPDGLEIRDYGLAQASAIIEMVYQMIVYGIDMGAVWAIQQNNRTELAGSEGNNQIRMAGEMFRMLSESIVGTSALDLPVSSVADGQIELHAFENETKLVIFISARDLIDDSSSFALDIAFGDLIEGFSYVWGEKLTSSDPLNPNAEPDLSLLFPTITYVDGIATVSVALDKDYEVIKLVFLKDGMGDSNIRLVGDEIDDYFMAGKGDDLLEGNNGNDTMLGKSGDDKLIGGAGADTLKGGSGNDKLIGGFGDDTLRAGRGDDLLDGGSGDDKLAAGKGNDILYGGAGDDIMWGGEGSDIFVFEQGSGFDQIRDFEIGSDLIDLDGFSFSEVSQVQTDKGLILGFGEASVILANVFENLLEASFDF